MARAIFTCACLLSVATTGGFADSLWGKAGEPVNMFADTKARAIGDAVTVLIQEQFLVSNEQDRKHEKENTTKFAVKLFRLFGYDSPASEQPAAEWSSDREHSGKGDFTSKDRVAIRLTATVKESLPNGNLVIEGTRQLETGGETRFVTLAGVVRPEDIRADNTVLSEKIADAKIAYQTDGAIARNTEQGWGEKIINVLWPF